MDERVRESLRHDALRGLAQFMAAAWPENEQRIQELLSPHNPSANALADKCADSVAHILGLHAPGNIDGSDHNSMMLHGLLPSTGADPNQPPFPNQFTGENEERKMQAVEAEEQEDEEQEADEEQVGSQWQDEEEQVRRQWEDEEERRRERQQKERDGRVVCAVIWAPEQYCQLASARPPATQLKELSTVLKMLPASSHQYALWRGFEQVFLQLQKEASLVFSPRTNAPTTGPLLQDTTLQATNKLEEKLLNGQLGVASVMAVAQRVASHRKDTILLRYEEAVIFDILKANTSVRGGKTISQHISDYISLRDGKIPTQIAVSYEKSLLSRLAYLRKNEEFRWILFHRNATLDIGLRRIPARELSDQDLGKWAEVYTRAFQQMNERWTRLFGRQEQSPGDNDKVMWVSGWARLGDASEWHLRHESVVRPHTHTVSMKRLQSNGGPNGDEKTDFAWSVVTIKTPAQTICVPSVSVPHASFLGVVPGEIGCDRSQAELGDTRIITGPKGLWLKPRKSAFDFLMEGDEGQKPNVKLAWEPFHAWTGRFMSFRVLVFACADIPAFEPLRF